MDKRWITLKDRLSGEFQVGVRNFVEFAMSNSVDGSVIYCPCKKCQNRYFVQKEVAWGHITTNGFLQTYTTWIYHGEPSIPAMRERNNETRVDINIGDDMRGMIYDAMGIPEEQMRYESCGLENETGSNEEGTKFIKFLKDAEQELYPGCTKFTALSFIVRLLHLKVLSGWTDKSFTMLLELLNEAFPSNVRLPRTYYEANKMTTDLGFTCDTWDACPNDCMLFRGNDKDLHSCRICKSSRFQEIRDQGGNVIIGGPQVAVKQVRYFPLKSRLQKLFMSSKTAEFMRWHAEHRVNDGVLRHPADSRAWKRFDERNSDFASETRNVRLGLACDGFIPFNTTRNKHSIWPVILMPYNLPPWLCMKQPFFILSTLVDGPKAPGNKIDVYLEPLIEELKQLWKDGACTYDAAKNEMFQMRAAVLWTINDFPAYANLSGWSTKGKFACPCCNVETQSQWLKNCRKFCYLGHRRFLPPRHRFRRDKNSFDGTRECRAAPNRLSGTEMLHQLEMNGVITDYKEEDVLKRVMGNLRNVDFEKRTHNWKKKSIFFELPYWEHNLIHHNLDVMHIEKNVCDNILFTVLGDTNRSKDNLNSRRDLQELHIRAALHPQPRGTNKVYLPPAKFTMDKKEREIFCKVVKNMKTPDGYASNISRCVNLKDKNISQLKSHDNHILMQQLIPIAVRRVLPKEVVQALIELSKFFRQLCSKVNHATDLEYIQERIVLVLCHLEKNFPPSFFDVMMHLPVHLAEEAIIAGPVQFRWMYPVERFLYTLKKYVRNRAHPEGSIASGYLMEECMNFCSRYLSDVETKCTRPHRNDDGGSSLGRPLGKETRIPFLDNVTRTQIHRYVLMNTDSVSPFQEEHIAILKERMPNVSSTTIMKHHNEKFHEWFANHVHNLQRNCGVQFSEEIKRLADGPEMSASSYNLYVINGLRFRVQSKDTYKTRQNSGVMVNVTVGLQTEAWYGILTDIIEVRYSRDMKFVLFKCDWVNNNGGTKIDEFDFTVVNLKNLLYKQNHFTNDPFILASQAQQVWYVEDPLDPNWYVVVKMTPRDYFGVYSDIHQIEAYASQQLDESLVVVRPQDATWVRQGIDGIVVDATSVRVGDVDESEEE